MTRTRHLLQLLVLAALTIAVLGVLGGSPVWAAASITFELFPKQPFAGQPAELVIHTWAPAPDGMPDLSSPINMTGYPFDVRVYRAEEFPGSFAPEQRGFPIELKQIEPSTWRAEVVFPEDGPWVIVFRNWYPPLTVAKPPPGQPATLDVLVLPAATLPETGGSTIGYSVAALVLSLVAFFIGLVIRHCTHTFPSQAGERRVRC